MFGFFSNSIHVFMDVSNDNKKVTRNFFTKLQSLVAKDYIG
jgi:hypothetical protein